MITRYCICGAVLKSTAPKWKKYQVLAVWYAEHDGPGHADTTAGGAEMARMGSGQPDGREAEREKHARN